MYSALRLREKQQRNALKLLNTYACDRIVLLLLHRAEDAAQLKSIFKKNIEKSKMSELLYEK